MRARQPVKAPERSVVSVGGPRRLLRPSCQGLHLLARQRPHALVFKCFYQHQCMHGSLRHKFPRGEGPQNPVKAPPPLTPLPCDFLFLTISAPQNLSNAYFTLIISIYAFLARCSLTYCAAAADCTAINSLLSRASSDESSHRSRHTASVSLSNGDTTREEKLSKVMGPV